MDSSSGVLDAGCVSAPRQDFIDDRHRDSPFLFPIKQFPRPKGEHNDGVRRG
jgi:hypothetical protein